MSSSDQTALTSTWTVGRMIDDVDFSNAIYDVPVTGTDEEDNWNTSYIGVFIDVMAPGTRRFIDPLLDRPVSQPAYTIKGQADRDSWVTIKVTNDVSTTQYTTRAGSNLGLWEMPVVLYPADNDITLQAADEANNHSPWSDSVTLSLDQTPPSLTDSSVEPLWQQVGLSVELSATVSDDGPLYLGYVQAHVTGPQTTTLNLRAGATPSDPWTEDFTPGLEGLYQVDITARDQAGNVVSDTHTLTADSTAPQLSLTVTGQPLYSHAITETVYYGDGSGIFTVTALMTDNLAGLDEVDFPTTTSVGPTYVLTGANPISQSHTYNFYSSNTETGSYNVTAVDRAGNEATPQPFSLIKDTTPPTAAIYVPPTSGIGIPVSWDGSADDQAGIRSYEVEYKEAGGAWTEWITETSATQATFIGTIGMTYTFQVRVTDNVDNVSGWAQSDEVKVEAVTKYYAFGGSKVAMSRGDEVYYLHGDHLGSTSLTTDDTGTPIAESRYLPYGQIRWESGGSVTDFGFTSQRKDSYIKLYDYGARWYDPYLNRFISPDPIIPDPADSQQFNRYAYVNNNPLKYVDPSGHCIVGYSGDVRMGQGPYGTSGVCPNTEHWITEAHSMHIYERPPPAVDGNSVSVLDTPTNIAGGLEVLVNNHTGDITVFGIYGLAINIGARRTIDVKVNSVQNIGEDNLNFTGEFVFVDLGGADGFGVNGGGAYTPKLEGSITSYFARDPKGAYSFGAGPSFGAGGAVTIGMVEYVPIFTLTSEGEFRWDTGQYLVEKDGEALRPIIEDAVKRLGYDPADYNFDELGQ